MKTKTRTSHQALTRMEVLVIIAAIVLLALCLMPALARARAKAQRIGCVCNLKQIGLSFKIWAGDHQGNYPMQAVATNGGTMELVAGGVRLSIQGIANQAYRIEATDALVPANWSSLGNVQANAQGEALFDTPLAANTPERFFRIVEGGAN